MIHLRRKSKAGEKPRLAGGSAEHAQLSGMPLLAKSPFLWTAFAALAFALAIIAWLRPPEPRLAPQVSFTTLDGQRLPLSSLRGKPVLVTFWATSCPTCIRDLPDLAAVHRELGPRGLALIAVAMPYDPPNRVLRLVRERGLAYTVALDVQGQVVRAFGDVPGTPTTYLIDGDGRIAERHVGPLDFPSLKARIISMLGTAA